MLDDSSSAQRGGLTHQAIEDYLKTIYKLAQEESPVSTSRLAEARQVKPASVTGMIQRLDKLNLVDYQKHYGVTLTEAGEKIALEVLRHHRLLETYLIEALGFSWDEVHEQADILEHVISEKLEERIAAVLNYPRFDPHGDPIPTKEGKMPTRETEMRNLTSAAVGSTVCVARILHDEDARTPTLLGRIGSRHGRRIAPARTSPV
ncbi:MAG: metal-dependent transcriptional regulator [Chloroflexi bacterium]|nr:metal-dependent transcriptional regulator [Chloroflexota bacterium]